MHCQSHKQGNIRSLDTLNGKGDNSCENSLK